MGTSRVDGGSYARLGPERGSMLTGLSAPACGCLFGECVGFPLSSAGGVPLGCPGEGSHLSKS